MREATDGYSHKTFLNLLEKPLIFALIVLTFVFVFGLGEAQAHPGNTDSSGGHTCRTNCPSWGYSYGEYHFHNSSGFNDDFELEEDLNSFKPRSAPSWSIVPAVNKPVDEPVDYTWVWWVAGGSGVAGFIVYSRWKNSKG